MTAPLSVFTSFGPNDIVVANPTEVSVGIFTGDTGSLTTFYTSSAQTASLSAQYYWSIYNINPSSSNAMIQFDIAYGHIYNGGNSSLTQNNASVLATQATYDQYRNILLDGEGEFTFLGNYSSPHIFVINFQRAQLKESVDAGNWVLYLSGSSGSFSFIDDSGQTLGDAFGTQGDVFNIVSGAIAGPSGSLIAPTSTSISSGGYGLFFPYTGLMILNPDALTNLGVWSVANAIQTNEVYPPVYNQLHLYNSMQRAGAVGGFQARSAETISSTHYFVRLMNSSFNYSNNPSFSNPVNGQLIWPDFIQDPTVFVTTIGLYNDSNELVAVAKLSQPTQKSFDSELLIRVRLDF